MNAILNSTVLDMWKREMVDTLEFIYGKGSFDKNNMDKYLETLIDNIKVNPICKIRNQYEFREFEEPANTLPVTIGDNNVSVLGNGMMTYSLDDRPALQSMIIQYKKKQRKYHKDLMLEAVERGDEVTRARENDNQNREKEETNSLYGGSTMNGSYFANIDCGSAITSQGRHLIAETMWCLECLLGNNYYYETINEYLLYNKIALNKHIMDDVRKYITHIPTYEECKNTFLVETNTISGFTKDFNRSPASYFIMMKRFSDDERCLFHYKNNIYSLIAKNPNIHKLFISIANSHIEFMNPYKIPVEIRDYIDELIEIFQTFVVVPTSFLKRVKKYQTKKRKAVLISDTDSVMPCFYKFVEFVRDLLSKYDIKMDETLEITIVNVIITICDVFINKSCERFVDGCNGTVLKRGELINFKNELYFKSMIVYTSQKKLYSGICLLQEGRRVPDNKQFMTTGRELRSATKCKEVMDKITDILENDILRSSKVDLVGFIKKKNEIENMIEEQTKSGIMIYGEFSKYKSPSNYKDIFQISAPRAAHVWNLLYPEMKITEGVGMYMFKTSLLSIKDVDKITDNEIRTKIKDLIYNAYGNRNDSDCESLSKFGLKYFAVSEEAPCIPEWVIPFIDLDDIKIKQLRPLTVLSPSLGTKIGSLKNSTAKIQTNLISF